MIKRSTPSPEIEAGSNQLDVSINSTQSEASISNQSNASTDSQSNADTIFDEDTKADFKPAFITEVSYENSEEESEEILILDELDALTIVPSVTPPLTNDQKPIVPPKPEKFLKKCSIFVSEKSLESSEKNMHDNEQEITAALNELRTLSENYTSNSSHTVPVTDRTSNGLVINEIIVDDLPLVKNVSQNLENVPEISENVLENSANSSENSENAPENSVIFQPEAEIDVSTDYSNEINNNDCDVAEVKTETIKAEKIIEASVSPVPAKIDENGENESSTKILETNDEKGGDFEAQNGIEQRPPVVQAVSSLSDPPVNVNILLKMIFF